MHYTAMVFVLFSIVSRAFSKDTDISSDTLKRLVGKTVLCAACSSSDEIKIVQQSCNLHLPEDCQLKEFRCTKNLLGNEPRFTGNSWDRICKIHRLSRQIAECAFEADDCILNEHESLTDSGKLKKERLFAFMMCQKYVEAKYCNDMTAPMSQTTIEMD